MVNKKEANEQAFDEACRFMIAVGKAAHNYGSTTMQIESFLSRLAVVLGYQGTFRATPSEILLAFQDKEHSWQRIHLEDVPAGGQELNRLARVGEVVDAVERGELGLAEATRQLEEIDKTPHPWGNIAFAVAIVIAGAGFAILLGGGPWDIGLAALFGLVVVGIMMLSPRFGERAIAWLPFTTALAVGALAALAKILLPEVNLILAIVCPLLVLVPGFPISIGIIELVNNHVVSGMANLMNGLLILGKQFAGAWLGVAIVAAIRTLPEASPGTSLDMIWVWLMLAPLLAALCFALQTARRDMPATVLVSGITFAIMVLGGEFVSSFVGNLLATIAAVILSNLWTAKTGRPTSITLLPALMLLVSGSIGLRGLLTVSEGEVAIGQDEFLQMFIVALTILAGLLVGNTIVRPKTAL